MAPKRVPSAGWIDHDGGPMPVAGSTRVQVQFLLDADRFAAERISGPRGVEASTYTTWLHSGCGNDIVAYREVAA